MPIFEQRLLDGGGRAMPISKHRWDIGLHRDGPESSWVQFRSLLLIPAFASSQTSLNCPTNNVFRPIGLYLYGVLQLVVCAPGTSSRDQPHSVRPGSDPVLPAEPTVLLSSRVDGIVSGVKISFMKGRKTHQWAYFGGLT